MVKKNYGDYYLGLDIGTDSVGWAVTDRKYDVLRFNGKAMWGIHLFDEGKTAEDRRQHRIARRRLARRNERLKILRELLGPEIAKVDPGFYSRMDDSFLHVGDREDPQTNSIFNDPTFKDKDYHKKYPTIYHLRKDLMFTEEKPDIRLVYLAAHHILKHRGHFLFEGLGEGDIPEFEDLFREFMNHVQADLLIELDVDENIPAIKEVLTDPNMTSTDKKIRLIELFGATEKPEKAVALLFSGSKCSLSDLFQNCSLDFEEEGKEYSKLSFKESKFEESHEGFEEFLGKENVLILDMAKQIYDWGVLKGILSGHEYISEANIAVYEKHKEDLFILKSFLKSYAMENGNDYSLYRSIFKSSEANNYCNYSRKAYNRKNRAELGKTTQADFCKYLSKKLEGLDFSRCEAYQDMKRRIDEGIFMPKPRSTNNSVFPNALHTKELRKIMENAARFYPSLCERDESDLSIAEKVVELSIFRIPYYVGPLGRDSKTGWVVRNEPGKIYPWNFEKKINVEESAKEFINNLVSTCTYLKGEKVLPANSTIYCRFKLLNELNNITVNGARISQEDKAAILHEFYELNNLAKLPVKYIETYFQRKYGEKPAIGGVDESIKSNLRAEAQLSGILSNMKDRSEMYEQITAILTVYGGDVRMLKKKLNSEYKGILSKAQIDKLGNIRFEDWGNLSEKFLTGIYHTFPDGVERNILTAMNEFPLNLMELLSGKYTYMKQVEEFNSVHSDDRKEITYEDVEELYCSPAVKRSIWRALRIVKEIVKITGHKPAKVFIETTREKREDGKKSSRKDNLLMHYRDAEIKNAYSDVLASLEGTDEPRLRSKKLFAYYSQLGCCMYCRKKIDLNDLSNNNLYDLDHIHPQSLKTDDSQSNNLVLVCRKHNEEKSNVYPIDPKIQQDMASFWALLKKKNLITAEKYERLVRKSPFSDEELSGFIARQLVETSQSVKAVAQILKSYLGEDADIVYVKGSNVSKFRHDNSQIIEGKPDKGYYVKCRNVNDFHHAKDAYLNIVVGNVYDVKFTKNPLNFINSRATYSLNRMFDFLVESGDNVAWVPGEEGSITVVDRNMRRNNIQFTRASYTVSGELFDLNLLKKDHGQLPFKEGRDISKYGGYNKLTGAYYSLVEHTVKGKRIRSIEPVPLTIHNKLGFERLEEYYSTVLLEPKVLISHILTDSLLEIDGFKAFLRSRSGDRYIMINAEQLVLTYEACRYCKRIFNYYEEPKRNPEDYQLNVADNIDLYNQLVEKLNNHYSKNPVFGNVIEALNKIQFETLDLRAQVDVLNNTLKAFQCNALYPNYSEYGGPKLTGRISINKVVDKFDSIKLISQSITGLFEKEIDLKGI